jgi:Altered inheritance of mitochondria protein 19
LGDSLNGAGITASWSFAYFLVNSRRSLRFRGMHPVSFAVTGLAGLNALVYGSFYFLDADTARRTDV